MRRITAIPSKKILFKNVPILGIFFLKRTLYKKISVREAVIYSEQKSIYFENEKIVRFIAKQHEQIAVEIHENKNPSEKYFNFKVNDVVEIISKSVLGKVVSVNKNNCLIQYKNNDAVSFDEFSFNDIKNIT